MRQRVARARLAGWVGLALLLPCLCSAQALPVRPAPFTPRAPVDGPPPPVPPAVVSRDATGHATLRAVRINAPIHLDGRLDEDVYRTTKAISDFIQVEPVAGAPATEQTEMWILFDSDNLYLAFRCWDSHPEREVGNEMRRDSNTLIQNEHVAVALDTFHDRRNMTEFVTGILGGRMDGQMTNETQWNPDFNPIWSVVTGRFEHGWVAEAAIPFKSLRYRPGAPQVWGFNARRFVRWKNEVSFVAAMPPRGQQSLAIISQAPTLVGIEVPPAARNIEVKPYAIAGISSERTASARIANDATADAGLDVKYAVTQTLTSDVTYNTDFAQVEADEQQVNLTRFSLFFPEKREFFLENQGTFGFGGAGAVGGGSGDTPVLFYSRRIGLNAGREVPLLAGGRLTGRVGRLSVGALNIESTDDAASQAVATNFSIARAKLDILRSSSVGAMATHRSVTQARAGSNDAFGIDGAFKFHSNIYLNTYWAKTRTPAAPAGRDTSYRAQLDYPADRYGVQIEHLFIGDRFTPDTGFVRRPDMRKTFGLFRFSPRTRRSNRIRKYSASASFNYIQDGAGVVETRELDGDASIELHNSDKLSASVTRTLEALPRPFRIAPGVTLPVGHYDYTNARAGYSFGNQRRVVGNVTIDRGTFYDGHRTVLALGGGRVEVTPRFSLQPTVSVNWVNLKEGAFRTTLAGSRVTYTMTPQMFASALVQYNSSTNTMASNVRLRWEYQPGSELFVVYNDQRDTRPAGFPDLTNRALVVKINKLFRF